MEHHPQQSPPPLAPSDEDRADATELLLRFLQNRDASCPRCGYNLRDLTRPVCPECDERLSLRVDMLRVPLTWFVVTLTPSIFSGICAVLLSVPVILFGPAPLGAILLDVFGFASGLGGVILFAVRDRFVRSRKRTQILCAVLTWYVHVGVFALLLVLTT